MQKQESAATSEPSKAEAPRKPTTGQCSISSIIDLGGALSDMPMKKRKSTRTRKAGSRRPETKRWIAKVKTVSTYPPEGLFTKDAATIAKSLASKRVSPKGPGSGMRMLTYFINRAGHNLSPSRKAELEKAKKLLSDRIRKSKTNSHHKAA
jgi:hypothetical protein